MNKIGFGGQWFEFQKHVFKIVFFKSFFSFEPKHDFQIELEPKPEL